MEDANNPEIEAPELDDVTVDQPADDTAELDEFGNPLEAEPDDDSEEIEYEGQKHRVPKALKDAFLMHSDYTRKTQAVATERQALEAEREQFRQLSGAEINARANVVAIDTALKEFQTIDWQAWMAQDPRAAQAARMQFDDLKDRRSQAVGAYQQASQARQLQEQQDTAKRMQEGQAELARDIPGWNQEKASALMAFGQRHYGFSADELNSISDPRMIKVLNAAYEHTQASAKQKTTATIQQKQAIKPAAKVGTGSAPARPLDDRTSTDAWMKARQAQVAKR